MAQLNFENKWVLITGASSGLGREIARYMAKHEHASAAPGRPGRFLPQRLQTAAAVNRA